MDNLTKTIDLATYNKLITSELRYRRLFETAQDGVLLVDFDTGMILDVNPFLIDMLGYSKEDFLKKHLWEVGVFKDVAASKDNFATLQKKRYVRFEDLPLETKTGKKMEVEFVANAYHVNGNTIIQCNIRDITDRKKVEDALRESEERFRSIFENGSYGIILTCQNGYFIKVNPAFCRMVGYSETELSEKKFTDITYPDHIAQDVEARNKMLSGAIQSYQTEKRYVKKSGEVIWVNLTISIIRNTDGSFAYFLGMVENITNRKKLEDTLRESNMLLKKSQAVAGLGSYVLDIPKGLWEGSELLNKVFGIDKAFKRSVEGWTSLIHPDDRSMMVDYFKNKVVRQGQPFNKEYRIIRRNDQAERWVHGLGKLEFNTQHHPIKMIGTIQDITDRRRTERLVNEIKTRDEAILDSIGDAVFACDTKGNILLFNKMAEEMTGISAKEAIGHHYNQTISFIRENTGKPSNDFIAEAIRNNKITKMTNHVLLARKDGSKMPVADSAAPIRDTKGTIFGCVVVFHDVTRERQIDKAKTEFVSLASHQLRTPLSTINWYSEILLSEDLGKLTPQQRQYNQDVYHASQRMVSLVNALLNVSRLELGTFTVEPKLVNIIKIAEACLKELKPLITKKKLVVKKKFDQQISLVKMDPKLLAIIFDNFLSNSIKYTSVGGIITLTISKEKNSLLIKVSDTGIGIPKDQQKEIFSKLFRADNAKKIDPDGAGLGLYIVKEIANHSGGNVRFESQEGKGTSFYVTLPLSGMIKKTGTRQLV